MAFTKIKTAEGKKASVFCSNKNVRVKWDEVDGKRCEGLFPLHVSDNGRYFTCIEKAWHQVRLNRSDKASPFWEKANV